MDEARQVAQDAYEKIRFEEEKLQSKLRKNLILSFAQDNKSQEPHDRLPTANYKRRLFRSFDDIRETLLKIQIPEEDIQSTVDPFFQQLHYILNQLPEKGKIRDYIFPSSSSSRLEQDAVFNWLAMQPTVSRINDINKFVEKYNLKLSNERSPLDRYRDLVNQFIGDSGKRIDFTPNGDLQAILPDGSVQSVHSLSSGERQIVVILTHLAFNTRAQNANVLIIDEPEISLHIKWQEIFIDALVSANPDTQILLATHSPSIVLDRIAYCIDL